jgi:glycosyltransferase involved in cell wall biosynthesis
MALNKAKLLIVGVLPIPVGGVTTHVQRLLDSLNKAQYPFCFVDIRKESFFKIFKLFLSHKWIHLHSSNVYARFIFSFLGWLCRKKIILTVHGSLGRFNRYKNLFDNLAIKFSSIPILLNNKSFEKGKKLNKNSVLISAFIPPLKNDSLENNILCKIAALRKNCDMLFCTNAYNVSYDKYQNEIYQVSLLVDIFKKFEKKALIVSDPSGAYKNLFTRRKENLPSNIFIISAPHNFFEILKLSDVFLRTTTTDGDSLSVKEALYLNKPVLATNVVDRPHGVVLIENNYNSIKHAIQTFQAGSTSVQIENAANSIMDLYKQRIR